MKTKIASRILQFASIVALCFYPSHVHCQGNKLRNVVHIVVDDFRTETETYIGSDNAIFPEIQTPGLKSFSQDAITFLQAYR